MITADEVRKRVEAIRDVMDDDEVAHILEDALYRRILENAVRGECVPDVAACAVIALEVSDMDFVRWCA